MLTRVFNLIVSAALLGAVFGSGGGAPVLADSGSVQSNAFGYTWSNGNFGSSWEDIIGLPGVVKLDFFNNDDSYTLDPVGMGWSFPFFENNYSSVSVSTNGLLMFTDPTAELSNQLIPIDAPPNNYIAPFWDDLRITEEIDSGVYVKTLGSYPDRYLVIQWNHVVIVGGGDDLYTFQVKLHESGSIEFNFEAMGSVLNESTVGIEDVDGVDGVQIYFNEAGLSSSSNIIILRPVGNYRFKATSRYKAGFLQGGMSEFEFILRNTGTVSDKYNLTSSVFQSYPTGPADTWNISYKNANTGLPLSDTDSDGNPDTGILSAGAEFPLRVTLSPNFSTESGNYVIMDVHLASAGSPGTFTVRVHSVSPANFAQLFTDSALGVNVELVFPTEQVEFPPPST
jgi:hypothetical protein